MANEDILADDCMRRFLMLKTDLNDITTNPTKRNPAPQDYLKSTVSGNFHCGLMREGG